MGNLMTPMSTHWRTGTCGSEPGHKQSGGLFVPGERPGGNARAWSIRCAAVCAMRRAPHEGQKPRRLQMNAASLSWPQSPQRRRRKPCARTAAFEEGLEFVFDELRQVGAGSGLSLLEEGRGVLLNRSGTASSVPGGDARSGPGRQPAPAGAAAPWLAREAPEVVSPHGLKPCAAPQSP